MATGEIEMPMAINVRTGKKEYTKEQLGRLQPKWREQWKELSDLDDRMIDICVNKIHTGPLEWPGLRIAEGSSKGMSIKMKEVAHEWRKQKPKATGSQIFREAKKRLNALVRADAAARDREMEDPFAFEYYLTARQRKSKRSFDDVV